jgi:drug/metabolite transporter (DMT)-like permease
LKSKASSKAILYLALLSLTWGGSFLLIKIASETIPPLAFATARMAIGALCLYLFLKVRGDGMPRIGRAWIPFLVLGVFHALLLSALLSFAEHEISSGLTSVLNSTAPIMTVILAHFLADETLTTDRVVGIMVGFVGVIIVLLPGLRASSSTNVSGTVAVLLVALFIALTAIYARRFLKNVAPAKTATGMMATAAIVGLPLTFIVEKPLQMSPSKESLISLVVLGAFCSALAFLLYYWLIANRGATYASLVQFTQPPLAIIFGAIFMGTLVQWTTIVGGAIILLCIAIMDGFLDRLFHKPAKPSLST